jgi:type IV pilus assembly protein PilQ
MTTNYQNNTQGTAGMLGENSVAIKRWSQMHYILSIFMLVFAVQLQAASLDSVDYSSLPDDKTRIILTFSESIEAPESFSIDDPARIVLDFAGITNKLDKKS